MQITPLVTPESKRAQLSQLQIRTTLKDRIKRALPKDPFLVELQEKVKKGETGEFTEQNGLLLMNGRLCVPNINNLRKDILYEAHNIPYSIHPGRTKMYHDLKEDFWWPGMKKDIIAYILSCHICQLVKAEHQKPGGYLHSLPIPEWKWEDIAMDFVFGLPRSKLGHDGIWVIIDRLTKSAHFIPVRQDGPPEKLNDLYIDVIVKLHGIPRSIISDRDGRFTSGNWRYIHKRLGTKLLFSTTFHPQTDGQSERTIQFLEDLLRMVVLDLKGSWEKYLTLVEFAYNNSYQSSIQMEPFEALYGRRCRTPLSWAEEGERTLYNREKIDKWHEKVKLIQERMKAAQDRQQKYYNARHRLVQFQVGDQVCLKIRPFKGVTRFRRLGKLSPRYVGPFSVIERVGDVAYRLELPVELQRLHHVFHVSALRKYIRDPETIVSATNLQIEPDLSSPTEPHQIIARQNKQLRNRDILRRMASPSRRDVYSRRGKEKERATVHCKKRNRLAQQRLNDLVFVKYNRALRRRYDSRDRIDPISLKDIDDSNEWLMERMEEDEEVEQDDDIVFDDELLTWGAVARASGVEEDIYSTRLSKGKMVADKRSTSKKKAHTPTMHTDDVEDEEEVEFNEEEESFSEENETFIDSDDE
ncbi:hypothetical protein KSP39_PZI008141 [Platanthera zijinensis]|uniref:Integrase catalytic domain-containing protein n=1 Tax=Platanthera zijinensis TaxID=2320716 RepID=A0AAP0G9C7_9ASPA